MTECTGNTKQSTGSYCGKSNSYYTTKWQSVETSFPEGCDSLMQATEFACLHGISMSGTAQWSLLFLQFKSKFTGKTIDLRKSTDYFSN